MPASVAPTGPFASARVRHHLSQPNDDLKGPCSAMYAMQYAFTLPAEILKSLGIREVRLLSNNPDKVAALEQAGVAVVERVPCEVAPSPHAEDYLKTKKEKLGHLFTSG